MLRVQQERKKSDIIPVSWHLPPNWESSSHPRSERKHTDYACTRDSRAITWHPLHAGCWSQNSIDAHQPQAAQPQKGAGPTSCLQVSGL